MFDIHEKKLKEEQLHALVTRYDLINRALVEAPWDMVVVAGDVVNPDNAFWWSSQFRTTLGFPDETVDKNGVPLRVAGTIRDITYEKNKETVVQEMTNRLELLSDCINEMVGALMRQRSRLRRSPWPRRSLRRRPITSRRVQTKPR
ncbi:hypothetical protein [Paenibacillus donghaensis]|uniref:hypothetical protein n=1 Tax=Paenibacillus donghaensis TaxID=414771 RepID=UPI0012FD66B5